MNKVQFGSKEMKELLIAACENTDMYDTAMKELYDSIRYYTLWKLEHGFEANAIKRGSKPLNTESIPKQDYDDIISEVFCSVLISLDGFILNIKKNNYSDAQRQAWLRTIVYNNFANYFKKKSKREGHGEIISIDDDKNSNLLYSEDVRENKETEELLKKIVKLACLAPSKPEKIIAYIYNTIIFKEVSGHKKNGAAQRTCEYMNCKTLFQLKELMKKELFELFGVFVTEEEVEPLSRMLGENNPTDKGEELCCITAKMVADWSNRMKTYMFKHKNCFMEEGESHVYKK